MTFYSTQTARNTIRGKKVRRIRWQNNASSDIVGAIGLWPSLSGLTDELFWDIDRLIRDIAFNHPSGIDLNQGPYLVQFGRRLADVQQAIDEAASAVGSDPATVSIAFVDVCMGYGSKMEPEITITTVTSGTKFIFGTSHSEIDFGEEGSTQRALAALQNPRTAGHVTFTDGSDCSGYLTRETLEEESQRQ